MLPAHRCTAPRCIAILVAAATLVAVAFAAPPKVIRVSPADGDFDVDPNLTEIRAEFDQDMSHAGHSVCGGGEWFPELVGKPRWESARVFVMTVKLKSNHDYGFNFNCPAAQNFRNTAGESAIPYSVNFATRGGTSDVPPEKHQAAFKELRRAIDEEYSYRDLRGVDWDKLLSEYQPRLCGAATPDQFGRYAGRMLAQAQDIHVSVRYGDKWFASHRRSVPPNGDFNKLPQYVPGFAKRSKVVFSGRYPDDIGYILIASWDAQQAEAIKQAYVALGELADCTGLIIDVRANSGGSETLAQEFAGCFVDKPVVYAKHVYRDKTAPSGFGPPSERVLDPSAGRPQYRGKVAVLTGRHVMSSCEAFLLMMKQVPGCRLVGETSYGSSGNPRAHELPNGIAVFLPSWKAMSPDGRTFEGVGIPPDVEVKTKPTDFATTDPVIDAALKLLRK